MKISRYERIQYERPSVSLEDHSLGPELLGVLSEHLQRRTDQKNKEDFVLQCSDFDDRVRTFEMLEIKKLGHDAAGNMERGETIIENLANEKKFFSDDLTDRFQVYAASRRESLLGRLANHQLKQAGIALKNTVNTAMESRSKAVYENPEELEAELELAEIELKQLNVPNPEEAFKNVQTMLADHAVTGVINSDPTSAKEFIERYKKHLTQDQIEKYQGHIRQAEVRIKAEAQEAEWSAREEVRKNLLPRVFSGKATVPEIDDADLPEKEKMQWRQTLFTRNKALAGGADNPLNVVDPGVDYQTMQDVYSGAPPSPTEIMLKVGKGLSIARAEHWVRILSSPDAGYRRALDYMKSQIAPKGGLMDPEDSDASDAYWRAVIALDNELAIHVEQEKPLMGNMILQKAIEITPDHKMTMREIFDRRLETTRSLAPPKSTEEEISFWDRVKGWIEISQKPGKKPPGGIDLLGQQIPLTDPLIGDILKSRGYASTPKNIKTFRENNGL